LCTSVGYMSHITDKRLNVEHLISKRTHKPIALRFWVRVWCLSYLCGCSSLDVDSLPSSPCDPTVVSEPWFDEWYDRDHRSVAQKAATTVQELLYDQTILNLGWIKLIRACIGFHF